jgi:hypothetical protein
MHFNRLDLLALQRVQAFIRHESDSHGGILFPRQNVRRFYQVRQIELFLLDLSIRGHGRRLKVSSNKSHGESP